MNKYLIMFFLVCTTAAYGSTCEDLARNQIQSCQSECGATSDGSFSCEHTTANSTVSTSGTYDSITGEGLCTRLVQISGNTQVQKTNTAQITSTNASVRVNVSTQNGPMKSIEICSEPR